MCGAHSGLDPPPRHRLADTLLALALCNASQVAGMAGPVATAYICLACFRDGTCRLESRRTEVEFYVPIRRERLSCVYWRYATVPSWPRSAAQRRLAQDSIALTS
jgi:hypothetical protein